MYVCMYVYVCVCMYVCTQDGPMALPIATKAPNGIKRYKYIYPPQPLLPLSPLPSSEDAPSLNKHPYELNMYPTAAGALFVPSAI